MRPRGVDWDAAMPPMPPREERGTQSAPTWIIMSAWCFRSQLQTPTSDLLIVEIKARQRRAKRNMKFMYVASEMKAGHPWFSRKSNNELHGSDAATSLKTMCNNQSFIGKGAAFFCNRYILNPADPTRVTRLWELLSTTHKRYFVNAKDTTQSSNTKINTKHKRNQTIQLHVIFANIIVLVVCVCCLWFLIYICSNNWID